MNRKVITSFLYPPIPIRSHDWCAYFDDLGADDSPYGWGPTEDEAVADLLDNYGDEDEEPTDPDYLQELRDTAIEDAHGDDE